MKDKEALGVYVGERRWKEYLMEAKQKIKINGLSEYLKVYEGKILLERELFADEIDKHHLLRILRELSIELGYQVIAFTLLDKELHLLLAQMHETIDLETFMNRLNKAYDAYFRKKGHKYREMVREVPVWEVKKEQETLLQKCYEIHTLASKAGYVREENAFWWSSMNSYGGHYVWEFVNVWLLLQVFSDDPKTAWECYQQDFRRRKKQEHEM